MNKYTKMMMLSHADKYKKDWDSEERSDEYLQDKSHKKETKGTKEKETKSNNVMFNHEIAEDWVNSMQNEDGTIGAHWTLEQTTAVAREHGIIFDEITDYCWWATMNMMYSDYCAVASKHNVNTVRFYADMGKAFLFDKDGKNPKEKISRYYEYVAM